MLIGDVADAVLGMGGKMHHHGELMFCCGKGR